MRPRIPIVFYCFLILAPITSLAQNAPDEIQVDPNAQCEQSVRDQITVCLDRVEKDESQLSGGPCTSSDWSCICTKQQGMVDCYSPCPGLQTVDMLTFNKNSCKGQNGVTITGEGGTLTYTWSDLPFTSNSTSSPQIQSNSTATVTDGPSDENPTSTSSTNATAAINSGHTPTVSASGTANTTGAASSTSKSAGTGSADGAGLLSPNSVLFIYSGTLAAVLTAFTSYTKFPY